MAKIKLSDFQPKMLASVLLGTATVSVGLLAFQLSATIAAVTETNGNTSVLEKNTARVVEISLPSVTYEEIVERVKGRNPGAMIEPAANGEGIFVRVNGVAGYSDWQKALHDIFDASGAVRWSATSLCAGNSCDQPGFSVTMTGKQYTVERGAGNNNATDMSALPEHIRRRMQGGA
jgi:hypothetical protein